MSDSNRSSSDDYLHQLSILDRCYHPSGAFSRFETEDIEQSVPSRFEQQVRSYPDNLAISSNGRELTYDELNQAANRVAWALLDQAGDEAETVALLFEQGAQAITALLGVLKAGKIFVPLDPTFPRSRTRYMVEDVGAAVILTSSKYLPLAGEFADGVRQVINIDELDAGLSTENPGRSISPDAIAYVIYTSGSTGQPKGVVNNHRNALHAVMCSTNVVHVGPLDRLTLLFTLPVNAGWRDITRALLNGAAIYPFDLRSEGVGGLADWLIQNEITIYHSVPTVFRAFVATLSGDEEFPKLRHLYLGGEPVYRSDIELHAKYFSADCLFANVLGLTEARDFRWYFIDSATRIPGSAVPVGFDHSDGLKVLLLNDDGKELGFNRVGQIAIKSRYLSPGYWRRPDLTRAAFLDDPNGGDERTYLTGDLGRMSPDGRLEHLGRKDSQVQVRGFRVELAEVEIALLSLGMIAEAVVVAQADPSSGQRLVAYVVLVGQTPPTVSDLRGLISQTLPEYMVPSAFVFLKALPLLPSGKVDRLALPQPGPERPNLDNPWVPPRTPVEEALVEIWSEVLGLDRVGIHDSFLELGGNSLRATQVVSRVISAFGVVLPLRALFDSPRVADMAVIVTQHLSEGAQEEEVERLLAELETPARAKSEQSGRDDRPTRPGPAS